MAITSADDLANALGNNAQRLPFHKTTTITSTAASRTVSFWRSLGHPGQANIPSTAATCNNNTVGGLWWDNPTGGNKTYISNVDIKAESGNGSFEIHDRLAHMGGLSGTSTSAQTVNLDLHTTGLGGTDNITTRIGRSDFGSVQWWLECYSNLGGTAANSTTVTYTNQNGTTGRTTIIAIPSNLQTGGLVPIFPTTSGDNIRSIQSIQLNASTGTTGDFGIVATLQRTEGFNYTALVETSLDWMDVGLPIIHDSSCLTFLVNTTGSSAPPPLGSLILVQG